MTKSSRNTNDSAANIVARKGTGNPPFSSIQGPSPEWLSGGESRVRGVHFCGWKRQGGGMSLPPSPI